MIGASRSRDTVGGQLFHNALESGFEGVVYPVNPSADVVQAVHAYRTVADLPEDVELAVIAVPAAGVIDVARKCAERGVRALVVISAGFAEAGPEGIERERELVEVCRAAGIRLVGPNCLGILNMAAGHHLNATFAPNTPPAGDVGFVSQSGALGLALIDLAGDRGLGVSSFASIGNRADITANDFLEYWESDGETQVALLYIESFSDPRRFSRVARRVGRDDADRGGEERPLGRRPACDQLPHRRPAGGVRRDRRCALRAGRRDPHRDALGTAGRQLPAFEPADARGLPGRHRHQRGRPRDHVRGRLRGGGPGSPGAAGQRAPVAAAGPPAEEPVCSIRWT